MTKLILGFAGEMAAGKGYATDYVKRLYPGTPSFRFSDSLREFYRLLLSPGLMETGLFNQYLAAAIFDEALARVRLRTITDQAFGFTPAFVGYDDAHEKFATWVIKDFVPAHYSSSWAPSASTMDLQWISTMVRAIFAENTLERAIMARVEHATSESPIVIVEGIRRLVDIGTFMSDPAVPFRLIYVEADPRVRHERHRLRNEKPGDADLTFLQFTELGKAEAEAQIRMLRDHAHIIISNSADPRYLETVLEHYVRAAILKFGAQ